MADEKKKIDDKATTADANTKKLEIITVKSKLTKKDSGGGFPVALHELDAQHPNGEIFVYGEKEFKVARTAGVSRAIADGRLEEV